MVIRIPEQDINIKDLVLEEPAPEVGTPLFEAEKAVSPERMEWIKNIAHHHSTLNDWSRVAEYLMPIRIVSPNFDLDAEKFIEPLKKSLYSTVKGKLWPQAFELGAAFRQFYPDQASSLVLTDRDWGEVRKHLAGIEHNQWYWKNFLGRRANLLIFQPSKRGELRLNQQVWDDAAQELVRLEQYWKEEEALLDYARLASNLRILFPNREIPISTQTWGKLKQMVVRIGQFGLPGPFMQMEMAANMKVLAAEWVNATAKGLELGPPIRVGAKNSEPAKEPVPEGRNF